MSQIAVIIVNWNTGQLLTKCVASLLRLPEQEILHSITVIDNASTDHSVAALKGSLSAADNNRVTIIAAPRNLGFARANNQAIARALQSSEGESPHILLLNPDTEVAPHTLHNLNSLLEEKPDYGVVGPLLRNPDGSLQPSVRRFPTLFVLTCFFLKLGQMLPRWQFGRKYLALDFDYTQTSQVDQVMGAAFLIRNSVWQRVGPLDEGFWVWFEEVDYCQRVTAAGWQVAYAPVEHVIHHGGVSFDQLAGLSRTLAFLKSAQRYANKHVGPLAVVWLFLLWPLALLISIPAGIARGLRP